MIQVKNIYQGSLLYGPKASKEEEARLAQLCYEAVSKEGFACETEVK
jgi:hypothetical protein